MSKVSQRSLSANDIQRYAREGESFEAASISGMPGAGDPGRLNEAWAQRYLQHRSRIQYTVRSYATPIAWKLAEGWVVPDQRHSSTTSKHQAICRQLQPQVEVEAVRR